MLCIVYLFANEARCKYKKKKKIQKIRQAKWKIAGQAMCVLNGRANGVHF